MRNPESSAPGAGCSTSSSYSIFHKSRFIRIPLLARDDHDEVPPAVLIASLKINICSAVSVLVLNAMASSKRTRSTKVMRRRRHGNYCTTFDSPLRFPDSPEGMRTGRCRDFFASPTGQKFFRLADRADLFFRIVRSQEKGILLSDLLAGRVAAAEEKGRAVET